MLTLRRASKVDQTFPAPQPTWILDEPQHQKDVYEYCIGNARVEDIKSSMDGVYRLIFVQLEYTEAFKPDAEQNKMDPFLNATLRSSDAPSNACDANRATTIPPVAVISCLLIFPYRTPLPP